MQFYLLSLLNWDPGYGLSSLVYGQLWVLIIYRSDRSIATCFDFIKKMMSFKDGLPHKFVSKKVKTVK